MQAKTSLSEETVKNLPVPEIGNKVFYFSGQKLQGKVAPAGFGCRVTSGASKSFVLNYRIGGIERRFTIGEWRGSHHGGAWSVIAAIEEAVKLRRQIDKGVDPQAEKEKERSPKKPAGGRTVADVLDEFIARYARNKDQPLRSADTIERTFDRLVKPRIGDLGIHELRRSHVVEMLDAIEDASGPVMADRTLAYIRKAFTWHAARDDQFSPPIVRGMARTRPKERARDRALTDNEIRAVWAAAEASGVFGRYVQFLLLTACRRSEAAQMTWAEVADGLWTVPSTRMKAKQEHVVPLSAAALNVLAGLPNDGGHVFSNDRGASPIGGFSKFKRAFDRACGVTDWTLHDLRRTARSLMSRAGVPADVAERCLAHTIPGVRATYDRHGFVQEKADAFEKLAAMIGRILDPPTDNVTRMQRRA